MVRPLASAGEEINMQAPEQPKTNTRRAGALLDLDSNHSGITGDVKVIVLDVTQPVGEVNHVAIRKLDVKLLLVEVDVNLQKTTFLCQ